MNLSSFIIYGLLIWISQIVPISNLVNNNSTSSLSVFSNDKLINNKFTTKPNKLKTKPNKKAFKAHKNVTLSSLSPVKLDAFNESPKTLYQISRDGRHQMLAFGSEITLALQTQQLIFEQA